MDRDYNCTKCQGRGLCGKPCKILSRFHVLGKIKTHFSGSSPPEIFVGRQGYPIVNTGILSPSEHENTEEYSMPELWHEKNFSIEKILDLRAKMVYARFKSQVKEMKGSFLSLMQQISLASKKVSTEIFLKKPPSQRFNLDNHIPLIGNPAPLKFARLEENPKIEKKVDYLSNDTDIKASQAIKELYFSSIPISHISKILSAGMLGRKRKLVPTRWSISATDDTISKFLVGKIRYYPEISEILLFNSEYLGNHYEFLLLPDKFSFEVMEAKMSGSVWNPSSPLYLAVDYEGFNGRKKYAEDVTGAYYANRLALCEFLEKIRKQSSCLVMRECRPEYYAPCGVGILREASRHAFKQIPEKFPSIKSALASAQSRMKLPVSTFTSKSWLLKNYGKQMRLNKFM